MTLLSVRDLTVSVTAGGQRKELLSSVSFDIPESKIVGMVGESGSGKSMTSLSIMGLLPHGVVAEAGTIDLGDRNVRSGRQHLGAEDIAMVFQNPRAALNPTMRIGRQIARAIRLGDRKSASTKQSGATPKSETPNRVAELLRLVGIQDSDRVTKAYPHQLSGGMCQRVMIAMALAIKPRLLIADEPTTGLDVTVQAQILVLLRELADQVGCSVLLITHDLSVVATVCDSIVVMYQGRIREIGEAVDVFDQPKDSYTKYLLSSLSDDLSAMSEGFEPDFQDVTAGQALVATGDGEPGPSRRGTN